LNRLSLLFRPAVTQNSDEVFNFCVQSDCQRSRHRKPRSDPVSRPERALTMTGLDSRFDNALPGPDLFHSGHTCRALPKIVGTRKELPRNGVFLPTTQCGALRFLLHPAYCSHSLL
jgi:hypothetical protein